MGQVLAGGDFFFEEDALDAAKATQQALIDTQERMGMMLDIMPMGLLIHTQQGILFANQEACRMLGAARDQLVGQHVLDFVAEGEIAKVLEQINQSFGRSAEVINQESLLYRPGEKAIAIKMISARLPWAGTPVIQILLQDVSDLKVKERTLEKLSVIDELTGIHNRRHVFKEAARHMENRNTTRLSIALMDVDHFKKINDGFGHGVGDQALISLAGCVGEVVRAQAGRDAVFARIGGEEFLVLLPGLDLTATAALSEKLRRTVNQIEVRAETGTFGFTISQGVAMLCADDATFDRLVARADAALYEAKRLGRNRVIMAK